MNHSKILSAVLLLLLYGCRQQPGERTGDPALFALTPATIDGSTFDLHALEQQRASVFVFLAPDCPLSRNYVLTLNQLNGQLAGAHIGFYGVVAAGAYSPAEITTFTRDFAVSFPLLLDSPGGLIEHLDAMVTPEAAVVDAKGRLLYKGAIDNRAPELGTYRSVITQRYLENALNDLMHNRPLALPETKAVGCFIERKIPG